MRPIKLWLRKISQAMQRLCDTISLKMMNLTEKEQRILKKMVKEQEQLNNSSVSFIIVSIKCLPVCCYKKYLLDLNQNSWSAPFHLFLVGKIS